MMNGTCAIGGCSCKKCWRHNPSVGLLFIRIATGSIFLVHGIQKLMHMDAVAMFFGMVGIPLFFAWIVAIVETLGGVLLITGIFTRKAAILLAIDMAVAIIVVKLGGPFLGGSEYEVVLLGTMLGLAFTSGGKYSLHMFCKCKGMCPIAKEDSCSCDASSGKVCDNCDACKMGCTKHE